MHRVLESIYRACYVLMLIGFAGRIYHRAFPKTDYDYGNAGMYIIAYYPDDGPGLLVFKTTTVCPEMLEWFREFRNRLQSMLRRGRVRLVTEEVPLGEIKLCSSIGATLDAIRGDLSVPVDDFARLLTESAAAYTRIQQGHSGKA